TGLQSTPVLSHPQTAVRAENSEVAMTKRLVVVSGPDQGRTFALPEADTLLLGRSRATETRLSDPHVSRVHCQVQVEDERVIVSDFDSVGGTFVNDRPAPRHHRPRAPAPGPPGPAGGGRAARGRRPPPAPPPPGPPGGGGRAPPPRRTRGGAGAGVRRQARRRPAGAGGAAATPDAGGQHPGPLP